MTFSAKLHTGSLTSETYPVLVVPAFEDSQMDSELKELDKLWRGVLSAALKKDVLTKEGEIFIVPNPIGKGIQRVAFIGMGKKDDCEIETLRKTGGTAANSLRKRDVGRIVFLLDPFVPYDSDYTNTGIALIEGARLGSYYFDRFKSEKDTHPLASAELHLPKGVKTSDIMPKLDEMLTLTTSTLLARDWNNTPANFATPSHLANLAKDIAREVGLAVRILDEKECEKLGMGAFLGVAKGSRQAPRFIVLDYKPKRYQKTMCLVGKAITFDSGGISIKPGTDMHLMKADMGGGMAVLATMRALGILKPEKVRVIGIVPACENMPGGDAVKPGDIVRTQSGKSIEVINTDAEGRLILADGLEFARKEYQPDAMVDVATLTGACVVALGEGMAGFFTDHDEFVGPIEKAAGDTGEKVWRMPLEKAYVDQLKSDSADTTNTGSRWGGAITAALFLQKFVGDTPWMHIDIAGPFWSPDNKPYIPKGATGYGPRLLYKFLMNWGDEKG
jgi:leucyl aminopeptidase